MRQSAIGGQRNDVLNPLLKNAKTGSRGIQKFRSFPGACRVRVYLHVQSVPTYNLMKIVRAITSLTACAVFRRLLGVKMSLWGREVWPMPPRAHSPSSRSLTARRRLNSKVPSFQSSGKDQ